MALSAGRGATTSGEGLRESGHHTEKEEEAKEEEGILTKSLEREGGKEGWGEPSSFN